MRDKSDACVEAENKTMINFIASGNASNWFDSVIDFINAEFNYNSTN